MWWLTPVALLIAFYFLPTIIAASNRNDTVVVFFVNLLTGWTVIGWFFSLILALGRPVTGEIIQGEVVSSVETPPYLFLPIVKE